MRYQVPWQGCDLVDGRESRLTEIRFKGQDRLCQWRVSCEYYP